LVSFSWIRSFKERLAREREGGQLQTFDKNFSVIELEGGARAKRDNNRALRKRKHKEKLSSLTKVRLSETWKGKNVFHGKKGTKETIPRRQRVGAGRGSFAAGQRGRSRRPEQEKTPIARESQRERLMMA